MKWYVAQYFLLYLHLSSACLMACTAGAGKSDWGGPTELQALGGGSQSQPTTKPASCWISCVNSYCVVPEAFLPINVYASFIFIDVLPIHFNS